MDFSNFTIMIVDDETYYRTSIASAISFTLNADIIEFENGDEAFKYLKYNNKPDLILLDIKMPMMDGLTLLEKLRKDAEFKNVYVIPYTQYTDNDTVKRLLDLGITDYIVKGLDLDRIMNKIKKALTKLKFGEESEEEE